MLFGVEGLQVTDAQAGPGGTLEVWAVTDYPAAAACPDCQAVSARRHDTVLARPRDVRRAGDPVAVWWVKFRWKCDAPGCDRKTFTEWLPQVPPGSPSSAPSMTMPAAIAALSSGQLPH